MYNKNTKHCVATIIDVRNIKSIQERCKRKHIQEFAKLLAKNEKDGIVMPV